MKNKIWLVFWFVIALFFRLPNVVGPMWTDEFSTAHQVRLWSEFGISGFQNPELFIEPNNILTHLLLLPIWEFQPYNPLFLRLPAILLGSLLIPVIYLFVKKHFDQTTAVVTGLLATTSYSLIVWSQQARGYALHQLLIFALLFLVLSWQKRPNLKVGLAVGGVALLGILTHITFIATILAGIIYLFVSNPKSSLQVFRSYKWPLIGWSLVFGVMAIVTNLVDPALLYLKYLIQNGPANNLAYYHSFLWRSQSLITIFFLIGVAIAAKKTGRAWQLLLSVVLSYLFFFTFIFKPTTTRYLIIFWPILLIFMAIAISELAKWLVPKTGWHFSKYFYPLGAVAATLFVIASGHWFTIKPKSYYSVNYFFREIAVLDYDQIYQSILEQAASNNQPVGLIDTWKDRALWYLPGHTPHVAVFRWADAGLMKQSPYDLDENGIKRLKKSQQIRLISEVEDLERYIQEYPVGFIYIDDNSLPRDVIDYAEQNFELILEVDRYELEPNPYAVWPARLYGWGMEKAGNNETLD